MHAKKIMIAASAVALLAAGCSKDSKNAEVKDTGPTPMTADAASQVFSGTVAPMGWLPFEADGFVFSMPLSWYVQEVAGVEGQLVVSNSMDSSSANAGVTSLKISKGAKTADKSLGAVATGLAASKSGISKVTEGVTNSGLRTASVSYTESRGTVLVVVIQKSETEYIVVQATGNVQDPFVMQIVNSMAIRAV